MRDLVQQPVVAECRARTSHPFFFHCDRVGCSFRSIVHGNPLLLRRTFFKERTPSGIITLRGVLSICYTVHMILTFHEGACVRSGGQGTTTFGLRARVEGLKNFMPTNLKADVASLALNHADMNGSEEAGRGDKQPFVISNSRRTRGEGHDGGGDRRRFEIRRRAPHQYHPFRPLRRTIGPCSSVRSPANGGARRSRFARGGAGDGLA